MKRRMMCLAVMFLCWIGSMSMTVLAAEQVPQEGLTFDGFLTDLVTGLNARSDFLEEAGEAMPLREKAVEAVKKEWEIVGRYDEADFGMMENEEYLREEYMRGLGLQYSLSSGEMDDGSFWRTWDEGYLKRACVLEELFRIYYLNGMPDELTARLDEMTGGYSADDSPEVLQLQELLGVEMDGQPGKQTILALKKKQEESGLEINGVVNGDRVEELLEAAVTP